MARESEREGPSNFEREFENLQRVVDLLERGDLKLEDAILQYESGYHSLVKCYQVLDDAKKRIEILTGAFPPPGSRVVDPEGLGEASVQRGCCSLKSHGSPPDEIRSPEVEGPGT